MIFKYIGKPLGVSETPIGFDRKCLELLPVFGNLIQGLVGAGAQADANRTNLRSVRETNEMNYQIAKETNEMSQNQFNQNMRWLREQYYDTDQVRRAVVAAQRAGLNPALALGNVQPIGSVGGSSPTSFHAAQMDAGHVEPVNYVDGLSESVGHAVDAYYNNQLRQAETAKVSYDAQISRANAATQMRKNVAELRAMRLDNEQRMKALKKSDAEYNKLLLENEQLDWSIKRLLTDWDETSKQLRYGNKLLERQSEGIQLDNDLKTIEKQFKPMLLRANLRLSQSQSEQLLALAGNLTEQMKSEYKRRNEIMPLEVVQRKLANGISGILFNGSKSYEDFMSDNQLSDVRNFIKMFGELLFRLAK